MVFGKAVAAGVYCKSRRMVAAIKNISEYKRLWIPLNLML